MTDTTDSKLVHVTYYDDLLRYISHISGRTKKVTFELPARFLFEPEKTEAFASDWRQENIWEERPPTFYGLPGEGALLRQIIEVTVTDNDVFDYLYSRLWQKVTQGNGEGFCPSVTIEP